MSNNKTFPPNNGAVVTIDKIIKAVMASAAEAELGATLINCKEAIPELKAIDEMWHKQPPTLMKLIIKLHMAWSLTTFPAKI